MEECWSPAAGAGAQKSRKQTRPSEGRVPRPFGGKPTLSRSAYLLVHRGGTFLPSGTRERLPLPATRRREGRRFGSALRKRPQSALAFSYPAEKDTHALDRGPASEEYASSCMKGALCLGDKIRPPRHCLGGGDDSSGY